MDIEFIGRDHPRFAAAEIHRTSAVHPHLSHGDKVDDHDNEDHRQDAGKYEVPETGIVGFYLHFAESGQFFGKIVVHQNPAAVGFRRVDRFLTGFKFTFDLENPVAVRSETGGRNRIVFKNEFFKLGLGYFPALDVVVVFKKQQYAEDDEDHHPHGNISVAARRSFFRSGLLLRKIFAIGLILFHMSEDGLKVNEIQYGNYPVQ